MTKNRSTSNRPLKTPLLMGVSLGIFILIATCLVIDVNAQTSLNFDGIDDQVTTTEDFPISEFQTRTIEAWIKTSASGDQVIAMWGEDAIGRKCVLRLHNEYLRYEAGDGFSIATETVLNDGQWHHVAAVLPEDGNSVNDIIMYVDGEIEAHPGHVRIIFTTSTPLVIGNSSIFTDRHFNGSIDELRIWNTERSAEEIAFYMNSELCDETGLVVRYRMDEGEAGADNTDLSTITDNIAGNNGTLENFTKESESSNWVEGIIPDTLNGTDIQMMCEGESLIWLDGMTYTEDNNTATFFMAGGASNLCDSIVTLDLTFTNPDATLSVADPSITANQSDAVYQWLDCNNGNAPIDGATDQTFVPDENGSYAVEITLNGCPITSDCVEIISVGIEELNALNAVKIYPNPNQGIINIELGQLDEINVKVFNINGKLIFEQEKITTPNYQFNLDAPAGNYVLEITSAGLQKQFKIVKQK